jgi:heme-degrading monooxygenase HmoA
MVSIFEYEVDHAARDRFEEVYGSDGEWAAFFRTRDEYLGTELHRSEQDRSRYLVIDYWTSAEAYLSFLEENRSEYEGRSRASRALYRNEWAIGRFVPALAGRTESRAATDSRATEGEQVPLLAALRARDRAALSELLSRDVAFHSPVRSYRGREDVLRLLVAMATVLDELRASRQLHNANETCVFVTARVDRKEIEGVLDEVRNDDGRIVHLTVMFRPLEILRVAIERMGQALAGR